MPNNWIFFCEKHLVAILFFAALLLGIWGLPYHGITWDEPAQRIIGAQNYGYIFLGEKELKESFTRDYGPAFELPLHAIERYVNYQDLRYLYWMRHFFTHLFFLLGAYFFFKIIDELYQNKTLAVVGFLFLVLMPVIYGHSFFNTKDIPFLSMFVITYYSAVKAYYQPSLKRYLVLGLCMGLLINLRIVGLMLFGCLSLFMFLEMFIKSPQRPGPVRQLGLWVVFAVATALVLFATFPYLWWDPWGNFVTAIKNMSKFRWEGETLFNGRMERTVDLPQHYVPVWFGITVPIVYLLSGIVGIGWFLWSFLQKPAKLFSDGVMRFNAIFLACFITPPLAAILLKSVLLDGWRHMFFIYPSFALLGIYGLQQIWHTKWRNVALIVLALGFANSLFFMIKNAPFQHLYFNRLVSDGTPEKLRRNFEMDYWGAVYFQSLKYIIKNDASPVIKIAVAQYPGIINVDLIPMGQRRRIVIVEKREEADYFITEYRRHPEDYPELEPYKWHSFKVDNSSVSTIFKFKKTE